MVLDLLGVDIGDFQVLVAENQRLRLELSEAGDFIAAIRSKLAELGCSKVLELD